MSQWQLLKTKLRWASLVDSTHVCCQVLTPGEQCVLRTTDLHVWISPRLCKSVHFLHAAPLADFNMYPFLVRTITTSIVGFSEILWALLGNYGIKRWFGEAPNLPLGSDISVVLRRTVPSYHAVWSMLCRESSEEKRRPCVSGTSTLHFWWYCALRASFSLCFFWISNNIHQVSQESLHSTLRFYKDAQLSW